MAALDGLLPLDGIDLLIARSREFKEPDLLAENIRWRMAAEEPDKKVVSGLREMAESLLKAGADSADLRLVLVDLCLLQSDAVGATSHITGGLPLLGVERALSLLSDIEAEHGEEARLPLERAVKVLAPERRVREAALDRAYTSGSMGFVERWSKKKELNRRLKQEAKREKLGG